MKNFIRQAFNKIGYDIHRLNPEHREIWIDVGAHLGEGTLDAALSNSELLVYALEPNWNLARQIMGKAANFIVLPLAVSDTDGTSKFFINAEDGSHSLCSMTEEGRKQWKEFDLTVTAEVMVPTIRLDTFFSAAGLHKIDYLKVDAEGLDLKVIQSAGKRLKDVRKIQCEVDVTPNRIYEGSASREEMLAFMRDQEFTLTGEEYQNNCRQQNLTFTRKP